MVQRIIQYLALIAACLCLVEVCRAEQVVEVPAGSVCLGQVWADAPKALRELDLGSAPPPGGTRLLVKSELQRRLVRAGHSTGQLRLPESVRLKTLSERWSAKRLQEAVVEQSGRALPQGVELVKASAHHELLLPLGTVASHLELSRIPSRAGQATRSGVLHLTYKGETIRRVPVVVVLDVSKQAAQPLVQRGATLKLYIDKSSARISAVAQALTDARLGDTVQFRVRATGRVVMATVMSQHRAKVVAR
jgi:hypothetical protein